MRRILIIFTLLALVAVLGVSAQRDRYSPLNWQSVPSDIIPESNDTYNLGSDAKRWKELFLTGGSIHLGNVKIAIDIDTGFAEIMRLENGLWQPASLELGADSLWIGKNVGVAGVGHHLATETSAGNLHFHAHSEFDGETTTEDAKVLHADNYEERRVYQSDNTGSWVGTNFEYSFPTPASTIIKKGYFQTHTTAATQPIRVQVWEGEDDTGAIIFDQTYAASLFAASTEVEMLFEGYAEYTKGQTYFIRIGSDASFSLKMDTTDTWPWQAANVSDIHEDSLLQTAAYVDGDSYDDGQYMIDSRKIYICNTTGVQTGTFAGNSGKWDLLDNHFATGDETDPVYSAWDKATGIVITESQVSDLDHFVTGDETDPIYSAWDKSTDISITESQVSDLDHFVNADETDQVFTAWDKAAGIMITESQISDLTHFVTGDETDPVFTAWDKDVADLSGMTEYYLPIGDASGGLQQTANFQYHDRALWMGDGGIYLDRSGADSFIVFSRDGTQIGQMRAGDSMIAITDEGGSPDRFKFYPATGIADLGKVDTTEVYNTLGHLLLQPNPNYGNVRLFDGTKVADNETGGVLYGYRKADEGTDWWRIYVSSSRATYFHGSAPGGMWMQGQTDMGLNSVTGDIFLRISDTAGTSKIYFKDGDNNTIGYIDSNGNLNCAEIETVNGINVGANMEVAGSVDITNSLDVGNDVIVVDDVFIYGDVSARNHEVRGALFFDDNSTQEEAGERQFASGHMTTAIYSGNWYDSSAEDIAERDLQFSRDGLILYIIGLADGGTGDCCIWQYPLTIPRDLSTVGAPTIKSIETYGSNQVGLFISRDGRRAWTVCTANDTVIEYSMTPHIISSLSWVQAKDISGQALSPSALFWCPTGERLFVADDDDNDIVAFSVVQEFDIGGMSWFQDFGTDIDAPTGLQFSSDGRRMYVMDGSAEDDIHEFHLSSPGLISSARLVNLFDVSSQNGSPQGIYLTPDNSQIFMVGTSASEGVYGYGLGAEVGGAIISTGGPVRPGSMTTTQRDAYAAGNGDIIYNTTTSVFNFYENDAWVTK